VTIHLSSNHTWLSPKPEPMGLFRVVPARDSSAPLAHPGGLKHTTMDVGYRSRTHSSPCHHSMSSPRPRFPSSPLWLCGGTVARRGATAPSVEEMKGGATAAPIMDSWGRRGGASCRCGREKVAAPGVEKKRGGETGEPPPCWSWRRGRAREAPPRRRWREAAQASHLT
jgi:hypothetical protein